VAEGTLLKTVSTSTVSAENVNRQDGDTVKESSSLQAASNPSKAVAHIIANHFISF